jgi:hypothetical protein
MNRDIQGSEVVNLARYRAKTQQKQEKHRSDQERLLDEITYHILMAARAIAARTPPK